MLWNLPGGSEEDHKTFRILLVFMDSCIADNSVEIPTRYSFVIEFIIPKFIEGSTCFVRHTAQHQELETVSAASGLYTAIRLKILYILYIVHIIILQ
jgi:hypothetical protein